MRAVHIVDRQDRCLYRLRQSQRLLDAACYGGRYGGAKSNNNGRTIIMPASMPHFETTQRHPAVASSSWIDRWGIIGLLALMFCSYPTLAHKLSDQRGGSTVGFHLSFALIVISTGLLCWLKPDAPRRIIEIARRHRLRSVILAVNLCVMAVLIINVFTKVGLLFLLGMVGICTTCLIFTRHHSLDRTISHAIRYSPISFAVVYMMLVGGEVFLRLNPQAVGGGGGGNPALRQIYRGLYTKNHLGLRVDEIAEKPKAGVRRVLLVGDSFTFGQGVADDETLASFLELTLNQSVGEYEVINAGRSNTNLSDHWRFVCDVGQPLAPDLVVVQFYLNDLELRQNDSVEEGLLETLMTQMVRRSYVLFALKHRFENLGVSVTKEAATCPAARWVDSLAQQIHESGPGWMSLCEAIERFATLSQKEDLPIYVVLYPHPGLQLPRMREIHDSVRQRAESAGLPTIDLIDLGTTLSQSERIVGEMDHHPSGTMHRLAAQRIAEALLRDGN